MSDAALRIWLLGGFRVEIAGRRVDDPAWRLRKAKSLVKLLALAPAGSLSQSRIVERLWPELEPEAGANNLQYALHTARRVLDPGWTRSSPYLPRRVDRIDLNRDESVWTDVRAFERAAVEARASDDPADSERALAVYGGELLPEDRYEDWTTDAREALHRSHLDLLVHLAGLYRRGGDMRGAIAALDRFVVADPTDESAHVALMRLHARAGERAAALRQYQQLEAAVRRELDAEPSADATRLFEQIRAGRYPPPVRSRDTAPAVSVPTAGQAEPAVPSRRHNLPQPLTTFVGRRKEAAQVRELMGANRLVTLTGPGGCGKTRLALAVAESRLPEFPDGAWLVDLATVTDPELVFATVAESLDVRDARDLPALDRIRESLGSRRLLLILDNCEHVLDPVAALVDTLLRACAGVRVLATSQQVLGMFGEAVYPVPPLALPAEPEAWALDRGTRLGQPPELYRVHPAGSALDPVGTVSRAEAVQLFVERARLVRPEFALVASNVDAVVTICRRLDGLPLAIELAAARLSSMPVDELAGRLDDSLHLLVRGNRTALPRHRTLRGVVEWSYGLLDAEERSFFDQLAVFAGGFTLDAVSSVTGEAPAAALDRLAGLVDRSLVARRDTGGRSRYRLLEALRQFARERLEASGKADDARRRHAEYFEALAAASEPALRTADAVAWFDRLDAEHDNIRAALTYAQCAGSPILSRLGLTLASAMTPYWATRGHWHEGRRWLATALNAATAVDAPLRGRGSLGSAWLARLQGDFAAADSSALAAHALFQAAGDAAGEARALVELSVGLALRDEHARASELATRARTLAAAADDRVAEALSVDALAHAVFQSRDFEVARPLAETALALARELGDKAGMAELLNCLGVMASDRLALDEARSLFEQSLALRRELGHQPGIATCLHNLAVVLWYQGDISRAGQLCEQSLRLAHRLGDKRLVLFLLYKIGILRLRAGDFTRSALLLGAAEALSELLGVPPNALDVAVRQSEAARCADRIDAAAHEADRSIGRTLKSDDAVAIALNAETGWPTLPPPSWFGLPPRPSRLVVLDSADGTDDQDSDPDPRRSAG